jgi:hypothetical protein
VNGAATTINRRSKLKGNEMPELKVSDDKRSLLNTIASLVLKLKATRNEEFVGNAIETVIPFRDANVEVFFDDFTDTYMITVERM